MKKKRYIVMCCRLSAVIKGGDSHAVKRRQKKRLKTEKSLLVRIENHLPVKYSPSIAIGRINIYMILK